MTKAPSKNPKAHEDEVGQRNRDRDQYECDDMRQVEKGRQDRQPPREQQVHECHYQKSWQFVAVAPFGAKSAILVAKIAKRQYRQQGKNTGVPGFHAQKRDIATQADI